MEPHGIFSGTVNILERALNIRAARHDLISANVANSETPDYQAFDLIVEEEMEKVLGKEGQIGLAMTQKKHFPANNVAGSEGLKPKPVVDSKWDKDENGNSVRIEREMANLAENSLMYNALAQIISKKFRGLDDVIKGGR
ncbi:MAG: flagellar basal body rod protein FlgB [Deltaproteobacteria bacterium]|nr:flagellar basal body rod protein FlgB [Deltaproteobacteria bacterium]